MSVRKALFLAAMLTAMSTAVWAAAARGGNLDDLCWRQEFADAKAWTPQPTWLSNASPSATVTSDGQTACFAVDEPGKGMKWSAPMPVIALDAQPYLVVRYRAENLDTAGTDYLVYLDDRLEGKQLHAIRLCDAVSDGRWHVAAVDVSTLTSAGAVHGMAVQVQAGAKGKARLWLDWLTFVAEPPRGDRGPPGATVIRRVPQAAPKPDWAAPLADSKWAPHSLWLSNPAADGEHSVRREGEVTVFRVASPGRGMKWSWDLPQPLALEGRRYVSMRYRATNLRGGWDYALCVIGKPRGDGLDYTAAVSPAEIISDGRWRTLNVDIREVAARFPLVGALAVQVQAAAPDAAFELADLRLGNQVQSSRLADALDLKGGAKFDGFAAIPIRSAAQSPSPEWRTHLRLADWFTAPAVTVGGVPFTLLEDEPFLAATSLRGKGELRLPSNVRASEVYLLTLAVLGGPEEPAYGDGKLRAIRDVDRFRLRLEYADGSADECLPMDPATKQFGVCAGPQVLAAAADPGAPGLKAIVLCDLARQGAFAVAAVTARTDARRLCPEAMEDSPPLRHKPPKSDKTPVERGVPTAKAEPGGPVTHVKPLTAAMLASVRLDPLPTLEGLVHRATGWQCMPAPCHLIALRVDGKALHSSSFRRVAPAGGAPGEPVLVLDPNRVGVRLAYATKEGVTVSVLLAVSRQPRANDDGLWVCVEKVANGDDKPHTVGLTAPQIEGYRLSDRPENQWYLVPRCGAAFDNRPCSYRERYCGQFPVQFLDSFSAADGRGLAVRTEDRDCLRKQYVLRKSGGELMVGVEYPERTLAPGESFAAAPAIVSLTDGHWRRGLEAYRRWLGTWHRPLVPRKQWFREVFNFRQRFLWSLDPLADAKTGELHLQRAVDEGRSEFGGIDYLHIFDWGNVFGVGRVYGRTGDLSPYKQFQGGCEGFRKAIADVKAQGVPVGLYIEGYLLQEKGKLGQQFGSFGGKAWQLIGRDERGVYWPQSTEMMICAGVDAWRGVQASTYAAKVGELGVDGMYIDQFGFADAGKDCWSKSHGHAVPSYAVVTERDATKIIREAIEQSKKGVAVYTEESPVDVTTQYQDGSFTYAMSHSLRTRTRVPLNVLRFAEPSFKTIEILYCDKPTGSWATGVKWVFFNGEAIWLEGPAVEWFEPETRQAIRRCHAILRKHRDAFAGDDATPLVQTEIGGVFANRFAAGAKAVYTLYNSRHRTVRGPVLRVPHADGVRWYDEWHERPAGVRREGGDDVIDLEIGPHGVGCIVAQRGDHEDH